MITNTQTTKTSVELYTNIWYVSVDNGVSVARCVHFYLQSLSKICFRSILLLSPNLIRSIMYFTIYVKRLWERVFLRYVVRTVYKKSNAKKMFTNHNRLLICWCYLKYDWEKYLFTRNYLTQKHTSVLNNNIFSTITSTFI